MPDPFIYDDSALDLLANDPDSDPFGLDKPSAIDSGGVQIGTGAAENWTGELDSELAALFQDGATISVDDLPGYDKPVQLHGWQSLTAPAGGLYGVLYTTPADCSSSDDDNAADIAVRAPGVIRGGVGDWNVVSSGYKRQGTYSWLVWLTTTTAVVLGAVIPSTLSTKSGRQYQLVGVWRYRESDNAVNVALFKGAETLKASATGKATYMQQLPKSYNPQTGKVEPEPKPKAKVSERDSKTATDSLADWWKHVQANIPMYLLIAGAVVVGGLVIVKVASHAIDD